MALKLIQRGTHEAENPIEVSLREAFELLKPQLNPPFSLEVLTQEEYSKINKALNFGILSQLHLAKVHIKHLHAIITDGYGFFTCILVNIVDELYPKLLDSVKIQLIWVTKEMLNVLAIGFDKLLVALLRQILGGDFSESNLWLCLEMVTLFLANWDCLLEEEPLVLNKGLYVFLRLLADHYRLPSNPMTDALKRMEVEFCGRLLREQFPLCLKIGRDLIRLLQDLVHIPEFKAMWKDLLLNPRQFKADGFEDISQIYRIRTPSLYFLLRITPEMETKLRFLLTRVKLGSQKRYQVWFAKKFLGVPERETILTDIARFICCSVRPSSEITQSDFLPRWAVIGWLLKSCRKSYIVANVKLALFYDWLFFDETTDNVMNIEPTILLMVNSIPKYIEVTHTLLEFLLIVVDNYDIERKEIISKGVSTALSTVIKKGIIGSLDVLTRCDMISPVLREMLGKMLLVMQSSHSKKLGSASVTHDISPPIHLLPSSSGSQHPNRMMGRASRPLVDSSGKCVIICHAPREDYYKKFLYEAFPVESHLLHYLHGNFKAEVAAGVIQNKQEAVDYLTWTIMYRRLTHNPNYYNLLGVSHRHLSDHLSELVENTISDLESSKCVTVEDDFSLSPLNPGMIASYYYISYKTVERFSSSLTTKTKLKGLLEILASASEYEELQMRPGEEELLRRLINHQRFSFENPKYTDPHAKAKALLQAHFFRQMMGRSLASDQQEVLLSASRLLQAMVDVISSNGWLNLALLAMEASQMVTQEKWERDSMLLQLPHFSKELVKKCQENRGKSIETVFDLLQMENDEA